MTTPSIHPDTHVSRSLARTLRVLAVAALSACTTTVEPSDTPVDQTDTTDRPAPPTEATAPERATEVVEFGAGDRTVVFESGFGNDWSSWKPVADEVASDARVFAYSRPGYGRSDPSPDPRDAAHIVDDLRRLLQTRGYAPPYVLVGHSFGGTYMELFAKAHPEDVAGLVLVDPRHRDFTAACEEQGLEGCTIPAAVVASLPPVQIAEYQAFASTSDEIQAAGGFGSYPVRVLTATAHGFVPEVEALWESLLGSLADEAQNGEQMVFSGASHSLHIERPHEVAEVIRNLVSEPGI